jgi:hypothetical protein
MCRAAHSIFKAIFALGVERIEVLLETLLRRFAVDSAAVYGVLGLLHCRPPSSSGSSTRSTNGPK